MNILKGLLYLVVTMSVLDSCQIEDVLIDRIEGFEVNSFDDGKMDGTLTLVLTNPNSIPIKVKSASFQIYSGKVHLGDADLARSFKINANATRSYPVQLNGSIGDILATGISGIAGLLTGKNPRVIIRGELNAGNFFFTRKVPVEVETELPINF